MFNRQWARMAIFALPFISSVNAQGGLDLVAQGLPACSGSCTGVIFQPGVGCDFSTLGQAAGITCFCKRPDLVNSVVDCVRKSCGPDDQQKIFQIALDLCGFYGVSVTVSGYTAPATAAATVDTSATLPAASVDVTTTVAPAAVDTAVTTVDTVLTTPPPTPTSTSPATLAVIGTGAAGGTASGTGLLATPTTFAPFTGGASTAGAKVGWVGLAVLGWAGVFL